MEAYDLLEQALETKQDDKHSQSSEDLENNHDNNQKDKKRSKHKEKSRDKGRDREKEKSKKHKDKDKRSSEDRALDRRLKEKEKAREKERHHEDRERERERSRKRSRDDARHRSRSRHRSKSRRHRSRTPPSPYHDYYGGGGRQRSITPRRAVTPPEIRAQREQEREQADLERHTRTVFAYNLNLRATERELFEFFSKAGRVMDVKLIMDRSTRKSKGIAYIEFEKQDDVISALMLTGQLLMGQAIMVKASEAEKNLAWEAQQQAQKNQVQVASIQQPAIINLQQQQVTESEQVLVSNLHPDIQEQDIRELFKSFGVIQSLVLQQQMNSGTAVIRYQNTADAKRALDTMDNLDLVGRNISVKLMATGGQQDQPQVVQKPEETESLFEEEGGIRNSAMVRKALLKRLANSAGMNVEEQMNPLERAAQLQKQQQKQNGNGVANSRMMEQGMLGPSSPIPTPCLLLKNLFDPNEESGDDWDLEIAEDVKGECEKYGQVIHIYVQKNSKGFVYLKFGSVDQCSNAQKSMHGRFFAKKQIVAEYQFLQVYNQYFKL